jgi:hypothetical protein
MAVRFDRVGVGGPAAPFDSPGHRGTPACESHAQNATVLKLGTEPRTYQEKNFL